MKVKFLGATQEVYRATTKTNPIRILEVRKGAIVDLPEDRVRKLEKDYPKDWEVLGSATPQVSEPVAIAKTDEVKTTKGDEPLWTKRKAATK
jgi:hypothetical protein